jgi:KaiC/GvpD/RAD55 family RecA-like ATPase/tetratricopeptide (TPR) repeat protein
LSKKKDEEPDGFPSEEELRDQSTRALKFMCNQHGINASGNKETIVKRLIDYFEEEKKKGEKKGKKEEKKKEKEEKKKEKEEKKKEKEEKKKEDKKKSKEVGDVEDLLLQEIKTDMRKDVEKTHPYTCSLCNTKLTGKENECPGCEVTFGEKVLALFDSDWDVYKDIPTTEEVKKMSKVELKEICHILGFEEEMKEEEMRSLLLELIGEDEDEVVELIREEEESFNPKRALEETNYIRDTLHKYTEALQLYDRIIEWELEHNIIEFLEEALIQKGICLQYMNEFRKARECYTLAQEVNPKNPEIKALLMGVKALSQSKDDKEPTGVLGTSATNLKERIHHLLDDEEVQEQKIGDPGYSPGFKETGEKRVEIAITKEPEPVPKAEEKPTPPEDKGPGKDEVILKDMDHMSDKLDKLKQIKDSIDLGDIENTSASGAGIVIDNMAAKATRIEEPQAPEVPKPPEVEGEIVVDTQTGEVDAEVVEEIADAEPEVITPEIMEKKSVVDAEVVGEEKAEEDEEVEGEIVAPKVEAEVEEVPKTEKVAKPKGSVDAFSSGNKSLDALVEGGFPASANILVTAPPFVGKEMILFEFIKQTLENDYPAIIVTTGDPIMVVRTKMGHVMEQFQEFEAKEMVGWVDPRSDGIKDKYGGAGAKGQEDYSLILKAVEDMSKRFIEKKGGSTVVFVSLTPIISYRDPKDIKAFLESLTSLVEEMRQVGLYSIDSDMHDETEIELIEQAMSGIIDIKENQNARSKKDKNLLKIRKMPKIEESRWLPFLAEDTSYKVG